jgi:hypothetical protein
MDGGFSEIALEGHEFVSPQIRIAGASYDRMSLVHTSE